MTKPFQIFPGLFLRDIVVSAQGLLEGFDGVDLGGSARQALDDGGDQLGATRVGQVGVVGLGSLSTRLISFHIFQIASNSRLLLLILLLLT